MNIFDTVIIQPPAPINTTNIFDPVIIPPSVPVNTADMLDTVIILPATPVNATTILDTEMNYITTDGIPREQHYYLLPDSSPNEPLFDESLPYLRRFPQVP